MKVVCSYCRKDLGEKEPRANLNVTHTVCPDCRSHYEAQWEGMTYKDYLDGLPGPAVIVDADYRLIACNAQAGVMLGKTEEEMEGLLGGEFLECVHARLPQGCGNTVHCQACAVRRTVKETLATGQALEKIPAYLHTTENNWEVLRNFFISTYKVGAGVRIVIEDAP